MVRKDTILMDKKFKIAVLIAASLFTVACTNANANIEKDKAASTKSNTQDSKVGQEQKSNADNTTTSSKENENKSTTQTSNEAAGNYKITQNVYKNKNIIVNYPQITSLEAANKQSTINQLIKNDVVSYVNKNITADSSLELKYSVKLQTPDFISIQYLGVANAPNTAHPNNIFYTTNISIKDAKKLRLSDIVKVDANFVNAFKKGQYVDSEGRDIKEAPPQITEYINDNISTNDLIKYFNEADSFDIENVNQSNTFSYLTKDAIVISINVPHALGDHAEFSVPLIGEQSKNLKLLIPNLSR